MDGEVWGANMGQGSPKYHQIVGTGHSLTDPGEHISVTAGTALGHNILGYNYMFDFPTPGGQGNKYGFWAPFLPFPSNAYTAPAAGEDLLVVDVQQIDPNSATAISWGCVPAIGSQSPPSVGYVSPSSGPAEGGTSVSIGGNGFTGATAVAFGGTNAASFTVSGDGSITAVAPPGSGIVDITVTGPAGPSAAGGTDTFSYTGTTAPAPTVTAVTPNTGVAADGTITITGTNFLNGLISVNFGSVSVAFLAESATSIVVAGLQPGSGTVDVTVTTYKGNGEGFQTSATSPADQYTYAAAPTITSLSPSSGPLGGGTRVTITGGGFTGATQVIFGGLPATTFNVTSDSSITATSPPGNAGTVDVLVVTASSLSLTSAADQFTYTPPPPPVGSLTRTFVSSSGVDTSPCTISQPCATFAAAYSAVAPNGIVAALDPGKYGPLAIGGPVTIDGNGWAAITAPANGNGITISAGPSDNVVLRGLTVDGGGVAGTTGIVFNSGQSLTVNNSVFRHLGNQGLNFTPAATTAESLTLSNSYFTDNGGGGILIEPTGSGAINASINRTQFVGNAVFGVFAEGDASSGPLSINMNDSVLSGSLAYSTSSGVMASSNGAATNLVVTRSQIVGNAVGVSSAGDNATVWLGQSIVAGNSAGFSQNGGPVNTFDDNYVADNGLNFGLWLVQVQPQ